MALFHHQDETPSAPQDGDDDDDDASLADTDDDFASLDDLDELEEDHKHALSKLAETDPEFFKYLQENDKELLEFGQSDEEDEEPKPKSKKQQNKEAAAKKDVKGKGKKVEEEEEKEAELGEDEYEEYEGADTDDEEMEEEMSGKKSRKGKKLDDGEMQVVTMEMLKGWQKGMLEVNPPPFLHCLHGMRTRCIDPESEHVYFFSCSSSSNVDVLLETRPDPFDPSDDSSSPSERLLTLTLTRPTPNLSRRLPTRSNPLMSSTSSS